MGEPTIKNGEEYFYPLIYEGNGQGKRVGKFVPFTDNATVANSCIFNSADSAALTKTLSGDGNKRTFTVSCWVKRAKLTGDYEAIVVGGGTSGSSSGIFFNGSSQLYLYYFGANSLTTNRTFEDTSKYYHILVRVDSTDSTADDRVRLYVDGEQVTSFATRNNPSLNAEETLFNVNAKNIDLGRHTTSTYYFDGYLSEVNFVDGSTVAASTFGVTDTSTNRWIPKSLTGITYGTNGFRLKFQDSSSLGDDTGGGGNDYTPVNLATTDQTTDSPTQNFITFSAPRLYGTSPTLSEGNLKLVGASGTGYPKIGAGKTIPQSGKWYWEVKATTSGGYQGVANPSNGVIDTNLVDVPGLSNANFQHTRGGMGAMMESGFKFSGLLSTSTDFTIGSSNMATGDYWLFAFDMDNGKAWWGWNDSSAGSSVVWFANDGGSDGNPATGANPTVTFDSKKHNFLPIQEWYAPGSYPGTFEYNFGSKTFNFTAPSGFSGLSQNNFPATDKGVSDLVIIKNRDATDSWIWQDSLRGTGVYGSTGSATDYATAMTDGVNKFLAGGFQIEDNVAVNTSGESYVAHCFNINKGSASTDTTGDLSVELQANATAGVSVGKFTVSGSGNRTWAHGLGGVPEMGILQVYGTTTYGTTYHHKTSSTPYNECLFTTTDGTVSAASGIWGSAKPSSTLWTGLVGSLFSASQAYVFYSFRGIDGFSKFGSYSGTGAADGPFIYLGFKPAYILIKRLTAGYHWTAKDTQRDPINPMTRDLKWNLTAVEDNSTDNYVDFCANGFKLRSGSGGATNYNGSGATHIYMAYAEHPFIGDGTNPVAAR